MGSCEHLRESLRPTLLHMPIPRPEVPFSSFHHHGPKCHLYRLRYYWCFYYLSPLLVHLEQVAARSLWESSFSISSWRNLQSHPRCHSGCTTNAHVMGSSNGDREKNSIDRSLRTGRWVCPAPSTLVSNLAFKQANLTPRTPKTGYASSQSSASNTSKTSTHKTSPTASHQKDSSRS